MILGAGRSTPVGVLQGELGWWSVRGRLDYLRLVYYGELIRKSTGGIFQALVMDLQTGKGRWSKYTNALLEELCLGDRLKKGSMAMWRREVRRAVHMREWMQWRAQMMPKSSLHRYMRIKTRLRPEPFLRQCSRRLSRVLVRMRAEQVRLQVVIGRWQKPRVPRERRVCTVCECDDVEDVEHLLAICPVLDTQRECMWGRIYARLHPFMRHSIMMMPLYLRVDWLLGTEWSELLYDRAWKWPELQRQVAYEVLQLLQIRNRYVL